MPASTGIPRTMEAQSHFPWLRELAIPAFFTFFGAALGLLAGRIRDDREARKAKESFLRAIGMELDALGDQLDASLHEVSASTGRVTGGGSTGPQFAYALRTSVFTSQVGKLRDVADPLLIQIVHFYSDLGTLSQIFESVNGLSAEFSRAVVPSGEKDAVRPRLASALRVLQEQITAFGNRLRALRAKLPAADQN